MNTDVLKNELLTIHKIRPIDIKIIESSYLAFKNVVIPKNAFLYYTSNVKIILK